MNANSQPPTPAIKDWLVSANHQLSKIGIPSATLDAEIILEHALEKSRTYLHAHPEQIISTPQYNIANNYLQQRLERVPIAYINGHKEFYGREFNVTQATLIPRPESEDIITILKQLLSSNNYHQPTIKLVDVGTGSGCLGITAKLEFPKLDVTLTDISIKALDIARQNSDILSANVKIIQSDLLQNYPTKPNIIIANLPYVDQAWDRSPETIYEPSLALFAADHGRSIIYKLIDQASKSLVRDGFLIVEADPNQHNSLIEYATKNSFTLTNQLGYIITFRLNDFSTNAIEEQHQDTNDANCKK
jgi:release factor glutamine methyltransferase